MLVFVDESGDTGQKFDQGSSRYFAVALVIFDSAAEADKVRERIDALRRELHLPDGYEFHFMRNNVVTRQAFFHAIRDYEFQCYCLVVDKRRLTGQEFPSRLEFYKAACGVAFEGARSLLRDANVQFDDSGDKAAKKELASYLKQKVNGEAEEDAPIKKIGIKKIGIKKIGMQCSRGNNLIQLADMVCGAVYGSFQENSGSSQTRSHEYRNMIKRRIVAVAEWPE